MPTLLLISIENGESFICQKSDSLARSARFRKAEEWRESPIYLHYQITPKRIILTT